MFFANSRFEIYSKVCIREWKIHRSRQSGKFSVRQSFGVCASSKRINSPNRLLLNLRNRHQSVNRCIGAAICILSDEPCTISWNALEIHILGCRVFPACRPTPHYLFHYATGWHFASDSESRFCIKHSFRPLLSL